MARYPFCLGLLVDTDARKSYTGERRLFYWVPQFVLAKMHLSFSLNGRTDAVTFCPMPAHPHAMSVWGAIKDEEQGQFQQSPFSSVFVALFLLHVFYIYTSSTLLWAL